MVWRGKLYIILKNYKLLHKDSVILTKSEVTSLFEEFAVFNERTNESACNIDKLTKSHENANWKNTNLISWKIQINRSIKNVERNIDRITQNIQDEYKERTFKSKQIATSHQIKKLTREKHKLERKKQIQKKGRKKYKPTQNSIHQDQYTDEKMKITKESQKKNK